MIGRDTENETAPAVLVRGREKGGEEIRDPNKDIENEGYHGVCAEWIKRNGMTSDCRHTCPISVTESSACLLSFGVIEFNLYVTSLVRDVVAVVLVEAGCLSVWSTKEALCCVNSAVL